MFVENSQISIIEGGGGGKGGGGGRGVRGRVNVTNKYK